VTGEKIGRTRVRFESAGVELVGYLHRLADTRGQLPGVVMGHGFSGTQDRLFDNAELFAESGFSALTFDYRRFGESGGEPRQLVGIEDQLQDWRAAIRFARGWLAIGFRPLAGLGGAPIPVGQVLALIALGAGLVALPLLALAAFAILLSVATQNSVASVVGGVVLILLLQLVSSLGLGGFLDPYLLTEQFPAWLNLMREPIDWAPIFGSVWVSAVWAAVSLLAAWAIFVRRDVLS
jgi:fermentation-respiration switch protein FrsA (DUF1100 family)